MTAVLEVSPVDRFNQELVANVHPPDWRNPQPAGRYNLVVIGAGTAGLVSAAGAAMLGAKVALIERHLMGGDCLVHGCVPSKAIIAAARAAHSFTKAREFGFDLGQKPRIDFPASMERLRHIRSEISHHDSAERFRSFGADVFFGDARFVARDAVEVAGARLNFSKAIIATGGRAAELDVPGLKEAGYLTNETVFSLTELPQRLVVVGGGYIGCELAQAFRRLGSEVTVLTDGARILPREDPDAAAVLARQFELDGIQVVPGANIRRADRSGSMKMLVFEREGKLDSVTGDEILVAVGRVPNIDGLALDSAGVEHDLRGIRVDDHLRTSNPRIYSAGDVCSDYKFTHAAEAMARIALQNALFLGRKKLSKLVVPWCIYTDPEIAHVGLYEHEARNKGLTVETMTQAFSDNDRAIIDGETNGFARVHVDKKSGRILGATLVSRHAGESIGELVLAMQKGLRVGDLSGIIHPYPTQAEIIKRLGDASMKSRLKPWMKRLLTSFLKVTR